MFALRLSRMAVASGASVSVRSAVSKRMLTTPAGDGLIKEFEKTVKENPVVVFMKGTPDQPMCGFSRAVVQVLNMHGVSSYKFYNVLEDEAVRQGVKQFTNWPTIPQVFINGEFVGGCDIVINLHQSGELKEALAKAGIVSKAENMG
eukprot:Opistho-2@96855